MGLENAYTSLHGMIVQLNILSPRRNKNRFSFLLSYKNYIPHQTLVEK